MNWRTPDPVDLFALAMLGMAAAAFGALIWRIYQS